MVQEIDIRPGGQGRFVERGPRQAEGIESLRRHRHPWKSKYEDFMKSQKESIANNPNTTWEMMKMPWQDPELGLFQSIAKHDKDYDPEEAQAFYERLTPNTPIGNLNKYVLLPALETADVGAGVAMKTLISAMGAATGLAADVYGTIPESVRDAAFAWNPYGAPTEGDMAMAPFLALEALGYNPQSIIARASMAAKPTAAKPKVTPTIPKKDTVVKDTSKQITETIGADVSKLTPYEMALKKSKAPWRTVKNKSIFDKLDTIESGTEVNIAALSRELNNKSRNNISDIIKEYYPDLKIQSAGEISKKISQSTLEANRAAKLAEEVEIPTVIRQVQNKARNRVEGYKENFVIKWPEKIMDNGKTVKENYMADLEMKYSSPKNKSEITNAYLAETYLGSSNKKNIAAIERINKNLVEELNLKFPKSEGKESLYYTHNVIKDSPFGNQVYGKASEFIKDKMSYKKINRHGEEVSISELHKGHPLQRDFFENSNLALEFIEAVKRPTFYTTRQRNIKLHTALENELIPLIQKNDQLKLNLNKLGESKKTGTQEFIRTSNEIKKLEKRIDEIANQLEEYGLVVLYPSFSKLKQYGKPFDNLMKLYKDFKLRKSRGEEIFKQGGRVGHKEGGLVKPKINPADYIEYYRDGTKLYKINSFIRDIARQIA